MLPSVVIDSHADSNSERYENSQPSAMHASGVNNIDTALPAFK